MNETVIFDFVKTQEMSPVVLRWVQYRIQDFFGRTGSLFGLISPWVATRAGTEVKTSKIRLSGLKGIAFLESFLSPLAHLLYTSLRLFVIKLVAFVFAFIVSNIIVVLSKGQKIVFRSFLVRLVENFKKF